MTADVCPDDKMDASPEECPLCRSTERNRRGISGTGTRYICVSEWHDQPAPKPAEPVSATPIEPVALRHFAGAFMVIEYHDMTPAVLAGKVWEIDSSWERLYSQQSIDKLLRELAEAKRKLDVQVHAAEALGRLVAEKDQDRIFFRNQLTMTSQELNAMRSLQNELQAKLAAETARAHNAAIDKCAEVLDDDQSVARVLALKVPQ